MGQDHITAYDAYCDWISKFWDCKDLNVAVVAALVLFLCAKVYQWFKTRRNKKAVGTIILMAIAILGLGIRFPQQIESFFIALVFFKVNLWVILVLLFAFLWLVQKLALKHKLKIAAAITGPSDYFIKDGIALKDYKWNWDTEANPQSSLGQFKEVKLDGRDFYSLTCIVVLPIKQVKRFTFGIKLKAKAGFTEADVTRNLAPNDIGVAVNIHEEGILAKLAIGDIGAARRKLFIESWTTGDAQERRIKFQVIVNDGGNLALMVNDGYVFSKAIDRSSLKNLTLIAGGDSKRFYRASIKDIEIMTSKTDGDLAMEKIARTQALKQDFGDSEGKVLVSSIPTPAKAIGTLRFTRDMKLVDWNGYYLDLTTERSTPQWTTTFEVMLNGQKFESFKGSLKLKSDYLRFGFFFTSQGVPLYNLKTNLINFKSDETILVHLGKEASTSEVWLTNYSLGVRSNEKVMTNLNRGDELMIQLGFGSRGDLILSVNGVDFHLNWPIELSLTRPSPRNRFVIMAWGDGHEYSMTLHDIKINGIN